MIAPMSDILRPCGVNAGSLRKIFILLPEDIEIDGIRTFVIPITTQPELYSDRRLYKVQADRNTAIFSEKKSIANRAGDYYDTAISFQVRKMRVEVDFVCEVLKNRCFHVLCEDNNGIVRYIRKMRLNDEASTGDKLSAKNGYVFSFTTKQKNKTATIPGITLQGLVAGLTGPIFGSGSNETFNVIPLSQLEESIIVRLRIPRTSGGYTEIGTLLGTLARYIRQVDDNTTWQDKLGYIKDDSTGVITSFDDDGTPDIQII